MQNFEEVVFIPGALEALGLDTGFDRLLMLEQVEGNVAQRGKVSWRSAGTDAVVVLIKRNVQGPVHCVFDTPMAALGVEDGFGSGCKAGDVIGSIAFDLVGSKNVSFGVDAGNGLQASPIVEVAEVLWPVMRIDHPAFTGFDASMAFLDSLMMVVGDASELCSAGLGEEKGGVFIELALIGLECQDIIGLLFDNFRRQHA